MNFLIVAVLFWIPLFAMTVCKLWFAGLCLVSVTRSFSSSCTLLIPPCGSLLITHVWLPLVTLYVLGWHLGVQPRVMLRVLQIQSCGHILQVRKSPHQVPTSNCNFVPLLHFCEICFVFLTTSEPNCWLEFSMQSPQSYTMLYVSVSDLLPPRSIYS